MCAPASVRSRTRAWPRSGTLSVMASFLDLQPREVRATNLEGRQIQVTTEAGKAIVPVGPVRTTLYFPGRSAAQVSALLERAAVRTRPPTRIFIEAEAYSRIEGAMAKGSTVGIREPEASGDVDRADEGGRPRPTPALVLRVYRADPA